MGETKMIKERQLKVFKKDNDELIELQASLKTKQEIFNSSNKDLIDEIKSFKDKISQGKEILTVEALIEYNETRVKKLSGGLGVQIRKSIEYDEIEALEWAKEKDLFLILDKKNFEKMAKVTPIDFVENKEEVKITFPKVIKL